ncbi:MAG: hypothetical protein HQM13_10570 [SAR324 cluster bacterium]|nr:hypothetical protein [SAR324 cluster bacterium]
MRAKSSNIILWLFLMGVAFPLYAQDVCQLDSEELKRPQGAAPKMDRYLLQGIYLGMSFKELQLTKPELTVRPIVQSGVIREYFVEHFTSDEHFLFTFSWDGRMYKLVYHKDFPVAVDEQELKNKLLQKYGRPDSQLDKPGATKVFEFCWGQCQMIRENVFCQDEDTDYWYTYFTASLSIHRKDFSIVLHDNKRFEENEEAFVRRKRTKQMLPSSSALNNLKL